MEPDARAVFGLPVFFTGFCTALLPGEGSAGDDFLIVVSALGVDVSLEVRDRIVTHPVAPPRARSTSGCHACLMAAGRCRSAQQSTSSAPSTNRWMS